MTTKPFFSIVIPTLNEEKCLPLLLRDLVSQSMTDFEVIVVDADSTDKTAAKAKKYHSQLALTFQVSQDHNVSSQRNQGGKLARAEYVIFMDADNRLPSYFLEGIHYQLIKHPQTDLFTTWLKVKATNAVDVAVARMINLGYELYRTIGKPSAMGALIGCRKSVLAKVQFDPSQKFSEDGLFIQEACQQGFDFKVFRDPTYYYSLRRLKKEGTLKSVGTSAMLQLRYLQGKDFHEVKIYPMLGGGYYDQTPTPEVTLFQALQTHLKSASKRQLEQLKKILLIQTFTDNQE